MSRSPKSDGSHLWNEDTLTSLLTGLAERAPAAPAIVGGEESVDYAGLAARVDRLAGAFAALGIRSGDSIGLQLPNVAEFLIAVLASARLGAVVTSIHMPYGPREAADILDHAKAKAVLASVAAGDRGPAAELSELAGSLAGLEHVIAVGGDAPPGTLAFADLQAAGGDRPLPAPPKAADPYIMFFTSGTSSSPKAVRTDYRRFLANARLNHTEKRMGPDSVMLSCAPYSHLFGLYSFHLTLYGGGATAPLPAFSPAGFIETCARLEPSHVFLAPAHIAACRAAGLLERGPLSSVKYMVVSGAMATADLYRDAQKALANGRIAQLWGMTETQCGMFTRPEESAEAAASGAGRPSPGNEVRVCAPDGAALPCGEEGELQIRGVSVFDGYHRNDAANADSFASDGWFRTGDLAVVAADGAVSVTGRRKDLINRGGVKINPADVEEAIDRHPDIVQSAIVPMRDAVLGERSCCFAVARSGAEPDLAGIADWLRREGIAKLKWPERLILVDALPLTPTRKVIKGRLRVPEEG